MMTTNIAMPVKGVKRQEPEWVVVAVVAIALLAGWLLKSWVESRTTTFSNSDLTLSYPATWLRELGEPEQGVLFAAQDVRSGSLYATHLSVWVADALPQVRQENVDPTLSAVTAWTFQRGQELEGYRVLGTAAVQVDGIDGARIDYAYVSDPIASPYRKALPVVVEAVDYLLPYQGKLYVITLAADASRFEPEAGQFEALLRRVDFAGN
jgi:hypothetical protein